MESIYYVMCWACHRKCAHCYDDRFRPYVRGKLEAVLAEAEAAFPRIIANLPRQMRYRIRRSTGDEESAVGRIILAGGELLIDPVRTRVLYPALDLLRAKFGADGARIVLQTTGDLITPEILRELKARGIWSVTCAGMDEFHVGMEANRRGPLLDRLEAAFTAEGFERVSLSARKRDWRHERGPFWNVMGAEPGTWIGELWPRGRAFANGLSAATGETNFCARQSGAKNFLAWGEAGSEVAIEPDGSLYPCCLKTRLPLGNVAEEPLEEILASLRGVPAFEALNAGDPAAMGATFGIDGPAFTVLSRTTTPQGAPYQNPCIGCDRVFAERLGPVITDAAARRRAARARTADPV